MSDHILDQVLGDLPVSCAFLRMVCPNDLDSSKHRAVPSCYTFTSMSHTVSTFEVRTPRTCEQTLLAMQSFYRTLPPPHHGLASLYKSHHPITIEFLNQGQTIYTLLTIPTEYEELLLSQLTASYPEVLIKKLEHNPLALIETPHQAQARQVTLHGSFHQPIQTTNTETSDPLTNVFSALSKLRDGDTALVQFVIKRVAEHWKNSVQLKDKNGEAVANQAAIATKLTHPSFSVSMRILTHAPTSERTKELLTLLTGTLSGFASTANSLKVESALFRNTAIVRDTLHRQCTHPMILSIEELSVLAHLPNKLFAPIKNIAWGKNLLGEPPDNLPTFSAIPEEERINVNFFGNVEFKNQSQVFGIKRSDRRRHMYAIGKSGTGKSTLLANMIIHDLKHGEGLAVIDPHGDLIETVLDYVPKSRINDVILFDPADPDAVVKLNLFEGGTLVNRELIASGIVSIFQKMYANSWGPRLEYILRNTLLTLLQQNAKLEDVLTMLTDSKYRARVVAGLDDQVLKNFWLAEFNTMPDRQRSEAIAPILNKVGQFVTSPLIRNVVNTDTSSFDIEDVMNSGKILLVNVSQGKLGEDNASLLGAMMITKIQLAAMNRVYMDEEKRRDFYLYIDEFQNFATTSFVKILSEARKYRLNLILANQYMDQIPDDVKSAIFGNAGTMVSFILGATDADWMKKEFGDKYSSEDLVSLGRYQIVTKLMIDNQTSSPFPAYTLSLANSTNQNREKVLRVSRERYAKKK